MLSGCFSGSREAASPEEITAPSNRGSAEVATVHGRQVRYVGAVQRDFRFTPPGITMRPPALGSDPYPSWRHAVEACFSGPLPCVTHGDARVALASVTGPGDAGTAPFGGKRMLEQGLVYAVIWGPGECRSLIVASRGAETCRMIDLVTAERIGDLEAGSHLYTFVARASSAFP